MSEKRLSVIVPAAALLAAALLAGREARAEWNGFRYSGNNLELGLNFFLQPRYEYSSDDGTGDSSSSFRLNLAGGRVQLRVPRANILLQAEGGLSGEDPVVLDSYLEIGIGRELALRAGYFRVPFDEQTTHAPFWLRMTDRSADVLALAPAWDLGIALRGLHVDDALAWGVSMTNGEGGEWENSNLDFLYSFRIALRLAPLLDWDRVDLVIGTGTFWTLEPWVPEEGVEVNRSLLGETLDVMLRVSSFTITAALLYRWTEPGAYGADTHALGWHVEAAASIVEALEVAVRTAQIWRDIESASGDDLEVGVAVNGFADGGRLRIQLEYRYLMANRNAPEAFDAHRAVVQLQAYY
jgi:hypothetical protein